MQEYISLQGANIGCGGEIYLKNPEKKRILGKKWRVFKMYVLNT
jgi:hypothetical protein